MDQELIEIMRDVYNRWTGQEIADVIAMIRREIEIQKRIEELRSQGLDLEQQAKQLEIDFAPKAKKSRSRKIDVNTQ